MPRTAAKHLRTALRLVLALFAFSIPVCGQTSSVSTGALKDAAKEPLQKGLVAAQQQDWKLAIRYFLEAQKADPDAPQIWFNLGLASSKLPGYELRALAWFQAYLLALPDAPNADAIRQQIATLEVAFESRMSKIIDGLQAIPSLLGTEAHKRTCQSAAAVDSAVPCDPLWRDSATVSLVINAENSAKRLAAARAFFGDTSGALNTFRLTTGSSFDWKCADPFGYDPTVDALLAAGYLPGNLASVLDCSQEIGYFLEAGELGGAQRYIESRPENSSDTYYDWEKTACEAFDRRDQRVLQDALAKAEVVSAQKYERAKRRASLGELLLAVGARDRARGVAVDNFNEGKENWDTQELVGLLVALGENSRADAVHKNEADAYRSGQWVLKDLCTDEEGRGLYARSTSGVRTVRQLRWWGKNRRNYLKDVALHGVTFDKCIPATYSCSDRGDDTQLVEFLRQSKDTLAGSDVSASGWALSSIAYPLAQLAEEYRRVHGPYHH